MERPTPNIELILQKRPGADPDLKAQIPELYFTAKQFEKEMGIITHTIRSDQVQVSIVTLMMIGIIDYVTVWDAELLLKVAEGMKRDDIKAKLAQNRKYGKLSRRAAAPGRSAKEAALLAILDGGLVDKARHLKDVTNEYEKRVEEKNREKDREIRLLKNEMEFEMGIITNYCPPDDGILNKECVSRENRRLMEHGSPALLPSDATFELCYELHHKEVLQSHKEAYVKKTTSSISFREYPSWKKAKTSVLS